MLTVKTYLDKSNISGIGLFAGENIKKGTITWKFNPHIDIYFSKKDFFYFIVVDYPTIKKDLLDCIKELKYDNSLLPIILFSNSPEFDETLFNYNLQLPINKNLLFNILLSILYTHK
jgi:hypothetical protein